MITTSTRIWRPGTTSSPPCATSPPAHEPVSRWRRRTERRSRRGSANRRRSITPTGCSSRRRRRISVRDLRSPRSSPHPSARPSWFTAWHQWHGAPCRRPPPGGEGASTSTTWSSPAPPRDDALAVGPRCGSSRMPERPGGWQVTGRARGGGPRGWGRAPPATATPVPRPRCAGRRPPTAPRSPPPRWKGPATACP